MAKVKTIGKKQVSFKYKTIAIVIALLEALGIGLVAFILPMLKMMGGSFEFPVGTLVITVLSFIVIYYPLKYAFSSFQTNTSTDTILGIVIRVLCIALAVWNCYYCLVFGFGADEYSGEIWGKILLYLIVPYVVVFIVVFVLFRMMSPDQVQGMQQPGQFPQQPAQFPQQPAQFPQQPAQQPGQAPQQPTQK